MFVGPNPHRHHASRVIRENLAHDLRRTYAQLGYEAGVPITPISKLLGHASIATTHLEARAQESSERAVVILGDVKFTDECDRAQLV